MLKSINPTNLKTLTTYNVLTSDEVTTVLQKVNKQYQSWRRNPIEKRSHLFQTLGHLLLERKTELGKLATLEMGKPLKQSISEVEKCAWLCDYYAHHAQEFLADKEVETGFQKTWLSYEPIGAVLAVMPWNYPYWQVFRFAIPTLLAGNVGLLKHASNVSQCAVAIEKLFLDAGFPVYTFTNLQIKTDLVEQVIQHDIVQAVSLTGSNAAGSIVASQAAKEIKKAVLELGGNDAFIICDDADINKTIDGAIAGRFQNNGQSCIAAKRFFIHEGIYDEFMNQFEQRVRNLQVGDPMDDTTDIGPMAKQAFVEELMNQINGSIEKGATLRCGGAAVGNHNQYLLPTILENISTGMPAFDDELFGPVAGCYKFSTTEEAIALANQSRFGLGASIWSEDQGKAIQLAKRLEVGTVAINSIVKSDPRVPFGGVKQSGFGRELAKEGMMEFVNVKATHLS